MSIGYTEEQTINKLEEAVKSEKLSLLYKEDCINYSSQTIDTQRYYYDVIAEYLLKSNFKGIFNNRLLAKLYYKWYTAYDKGG